MDDRASHIERLLGEGLDLCVRARRMQQQEEELLTLWSNNPHMTRSATIPLWAEDQYQRDLAEWEAAAREALREPSQ